MPNKLWNQLMRLPSLPKNTIRLEKPLMKKPFTIAFKTTTDEEGNIVPEYVGRKEGVLKLSDFDGATVLNIVHKNNKTTVVR